MRTSQRGTMSIPVPTNLGTRKYIAPNAIFNPKCAYVLIAIGRASIQQGVKLVMPAWGADGYFEYPNAVRVPVLNRNVLIIRPLGYKLSPSHALAMSSASAIGIPPDGDFGLYLGAGQPWSGDIASQLASTPGDRNDRREREGRPNFFFLVFF